MREDIYVGNDAYSVAQRKARYGHRNWLFWADKTGQKKAALMTPASVKQAMLDSGTQGKFLLMHSSGGGGLLTDWSMGAMWLRSAKHGHFYHF